MTFPPFRKGGLGGISTEYPNPSCTCCTTYCGMLTTQEYAPAGGSFCTDCVCQNPPHSPFTKGGGSKPCNSFPHPQKLTSITPARYHPGIIRQRLLYSLSLWGEG